MSVNRPDDRSQRIRQGADGDRTIDEIDDAFPEHLGVEPDVPVPDVIDQRRSVVFDDESGR